MPRNFGGQERDRHLEQFLIGWLVATIIIELFKSLVRGIVWHFFLSEEAKQEITALKKRKKQSQQPSMFSFLGNLVKRLI